MAAARISILSSSPGRNQLEAVFAAYGWPSDLSDEEILERLLALNLERSTVTRILPE